MAEEDARSGGGRESEVRPARPSASPAAEAVAAGASEGAASSDPDDPDDPDSEDAKPANSRPKRADPDVAVRVSVRVGPGTDTVTGTGSSKTGTGAGAEGPSADSDGADDEAQDAGTGTEAAEDPDVAADAAGVEEAEAAEAAEAAEDAKDAEDTARERPGADDGDDSKGPAADREDGGDQGPAAAQDILKRYVKPLVSDLPERPDDDGPVVFGIPGRPVIARPTPYAPARPVPEPLPPAERSAVREAGARAATAGLGVGTDLAAAEGEAVGPEGTRAMEVPPAPYQAPLKLLAELTNTPPPRQTAWRSTLRRFKIWTPLVVLLAVVFVIVQAVRPLPAPDLSLTAAPTFTFLGTPLPDSMPWPAQGQSVAEVEGLGSLGVHGAQTPVPIASVTKVMTAYLILRDHPLTGKQNGPLITVDQQAADESSSTDESTAAVKVGQRFSERQMLQMLLIPSGNNIARLLARWDSGTQEAFVTKMTAAAAQLGMANTTYTGASGFEETTVSTAEDQLKLARQVMKNDAFRSVVSLPNVEIPGVGTIFNNNNDLVNQGVVGIKTGSSTPAGGALMWAAHKTVGGKQQLILGVVLQQRGGTTVFDSLQTALKNSQKLIESVQGGLTSSTIVKKGEVVGEVHDGLGGSTPVVADKDLVAIGWPGMKADITLDANSSGVPHNAKAGTQVGTIGFGTGSARTSVPVVLGSDLKEPSFTKKLTRF